MALLTKLQYIPNWTQSEKQLADFILANGPQVLDLTSKQLAAQSYTSISTVYRVCDKLGLNGFNDLKLLLARELNTPKIGQIDYNMPFSPKANDYEIMESINNLYRQTVDETMSLMNLSTLHQCVSLLDRCQCINIITSAINAQPAQQFAAKMARVGKNVRVLTQMFDMEMSVCHPQPGSVFIFLSYAGRNKEMLPIIQMLRKNSSPIILISSLLDETYEKYADYHIYLCSQESRFSQSKIADYSLTVSSNYVFDVLYSILYKRNAKSYQEEVARESEYYNMAYRSYIKNGSV